MLKETVQQANHVFSLPIGPSVPSVRPVFLAPTNKKVMPEMVNAAICPYTVKSFKHNDIITLLRYKICCMRSTANEIVCLTHGLKRGIKGTNTIKFIRREYLYQQDEKSHMAPLWWTSKHTKKKRISIALQWVDIRLNIRWINQPTQQASPQQKCFSTVPYPHLEPVFW
jgi:hypothetical protein